MKFVSWNVNGLRACIGKGFLDYFMGTDADVFAYRRQSSLTASFPWSCRLPPVLELCRQKGLFRYGSFCKRGARFCYLWCRCAGTGHRGKNDYIGISEFLFGYLLYAQRPAGACRIDHRLNWDEAFRARLTALDANKPVIVAVI